VRAVAGAFLVTMLGTTMPTPLYPLYQARLGFDGFVVTVVFATYAVGVLAALLLFGALSDRIGRKAVLLPGLGLAAASSAVFLVPDSLPALFAGRLLSGLSAGIFTGVATAMIVDLAPPGGRPRAALLAACVNVLGLGLGPVVAGALAQYAPAPLELTYLLHLGLLVPAAVGLALAPEPVARRPFRWQVQRLSVPPAARPVFVRAGTAGFAGFAVLGFFTAVSPLFVGQVLREPSPLLVGGVVFAVLGSSAAGQLLSARLGERASLLAGCAALAAGILVVAAGLVAAALPLVLAGAVLAGLGQGAAFRAGLAAVTGAAPADRRSEVSSAFFLVVYVALSIPVVGVGAASQAFGLVPAAVAFAVLVALLAAAALVSLARATAAPAAPAPD
jgi:predicted MFS family arabinose efflux permease